MAGVSLVVVEGPVEEEPGVVVESPEVETGSVVPPGVEVDEPEPAGKVLPGVEGEGSTPVCTGGEVAPGSVPVGSVPLGGGGGVSVEPPEEHASSAGTLSEAMMVRTMNEMER